MILIKAVVNTGDNAKRLSYVLIIYKLIETRETSNNLFPVK
jgi:hypothetical protein